MADYRPRPPAYSEAAQQAAEDWWDAHEDEVMEEIANGERDSRGRPIPPSFDPFD